MKEARERYFDLLRSSYQVLKILRADRNLYRLLDFPVKGSWALITCIKGKVKTIPFKAGSFPAIVEGQAMGILEVSGDHAYFYKI